MSIISLTIFNLLRWKTLESFKTYELGDINQMIRNNFYTMTYITLLLLVTTIPAVLVAINCNKHNQIGYGILAFLLSDIYLLQWAIKKFIMKKTYYCPL